MTKVFRRSIRLSLAALTWLVVGTAPAWSATTRVVGNNGEDVSGCGTTIKPCRTITYTLGQAVAGDVIVVGPGRYGDANGDNSFGDPGDEPGAISVNVAVTIVSRDGAAATVIDSGGQAVHAVSITQSNVTFGQANKGFTLTGAASGSHGLAISGSNVRVTGNVAVGNDGNGFQDDNTGSPPTRFTANRAIWNGGAGFKAGEGADLYNNVASGNTHGFSLGTNTGDISEASGNLAIGNTVGFEITGTQVEFSGNAALGNADDGIRVVAGAPVLERNSIFGNGGCGINNTGPGTVDAGDNFWGAPGGPGGDPADTACQVSIITAPVRPNEVKVSVKALK